MLHHSSPVSVMLVF